MTSAPRAQVACRFEERHDAQGRGYARDALQQLDREHIRGAAGLRDDVGPERFARDRGDHAERVEHLRDPRAGRPARQRRHRVARDAPVVREDVEEKVDPPLLGPRLVASEPQAAGDRIDGFRVPFRFLPHVEAHQRQPEGRNTAQRVREPAVGNEPVPRVAERPVAETQRFGERVGRFEERAGRRYRRSALVLGQLSLDPAHRPLEPLL